MRFGLLGDDPLALPLARAVAATGHELVWLGETGPQSRALQEIAPRAQLGRAWESLLTDCRTDIVIVGRARDAEQRTQQVRTLARGGISLLMVHPICPAVEVYYELDMVRREASVFLRHYVPGETHPALEQAAHWVAGGDAQLGKVEQLVFERFLENRTREVVLDQWVRDADLIAGVCGLPERIVALAAADEQSTYENLGVQMRFPTRLMAQWSVRPLQEDGAASVTLIGTAGRAILKMTEGDRPWSVERMHGGQATRQEFPVWDDAAAAVEQMVCAVGQPIMNREGEDRTWTRAARSVEIAEAVEISVRKGRSVDLHTGEQSEASTFKAIMATAGCGLLLVGLALAILIGLVDALNLPAARHWPAFLLVLLVAFLISQGLLKLVVKDRPGSEDGQTLAVVSKKAEPGRR